AMKGISDVIRYHDNICRAPMLKVLEEDGIDHETAFKLALVPDRADGAGKGSGDSGSGSYYEMDERRRLIKRYSRETLGFDIDKEFRHDRGELNNES
ncbi:MAG: hypothetical protein J5966_02420, partial [Lachnospiraceae bacterium]|nr:hypothetical protein [Lachnospiraceae bacterium]